MLLARYNQESEQGVGVFALGYSQPQTRDNTFEEMYSYSMSWCHYLVSWQLHVGPEIQTLDCIL